MNIWFRQQSAEFMIVTKVFIYWDHEYSSFQTKENFNLK